ncbi:MAG TPA: porin family protein [Mariprofundaceae bacterium]|nr:porin family protein [Mariprofundaceae bacterium]
MKRWIIAALAAATLGATAAQASDPYVGIGVGGFNIDNGVSKKMAAGAYLQVGDDFSQYLGGEVRIGASDRTGQAFPLQAQTRIDYFAAAYLKPRYELNEQYTVYGLLGVATVRASYAAPGTLQQKKTRNGFAYGLGIDYRYNENVSFGAEWSHMLTKPSITPAAIGTNFQGVSSSVYTASLKYHFF